MDLVDKLDRLINTVDGVLVVLDEMIMQEQFKCFSGAFNCLDLALDALCEARGAYGKDK